jgi:anaerobic selenocysteine-containing dehydrogenase
MSATVWPWENRLPAIKPGERLQFGTNPEECGLQVSQPAVRPRYGVAT